MRSTPRGKSSESGASRGLVIRTSDLHEICAEEVFFGVRHSPRIWLLDEIYTRSALRKWPSEFADDEICLKEPFRVLRGRGLR